MSDSDSWATPQALFDELNQEFNFSIDLCATEGNRKCNTWGEDYLKDKYLAWFDRPHKTIKNILGVIDGQGFSAFMNPPYSNPKPFIEKAWEDSKHCKIVCLVKCDPSTKWWSTFWNYVPKKDYICCMRCGGGQVEVLVGESPNSPPTRCSACFGAGRRYVETEAIGPKPGCEVRFFPKRIKFDAPRGFEGKTSGPSFSSALIIMDRRGIS